MLLLSMCLRHMGMYSILDLKPSTFNQYYPERYLMFIQTLGCFFPRCGFSGAWISATFMRNMSWIYCACRIIWVRFNLYSASAYQPSLLSCFRCYQCCEAAAGIPQLILPCHTCWIRTSTHWIIPPQTWSKLINDI